ncbi:MAG: TPM domain-containing protein [Treponema sp.]|jgi:uncharacterized protein|nr:TPM domain-containing protein [Treponema sp.]
MKYTKIKLLVFVLLITAFSFPAFTQQRIVDNAGLLSPAEITSLLEKINSAAGTYGVDLVIVTEKSTGSASTRDFADDFFDYNGYGYGVDRDGCLFLIVMDTRDFWLSSSGRGEKILLSYAGVKLEEDILKYLRADNYYEAYFSFISNWEKFLSLEAKGRSYNFFQHRHTALVIGAWIIAFGTAFIIIQVWKRGMNTVLGKKEAGAYMINGSLSFTAKSDRFLYSTVTKVRRQTNSGSGGGGRHISSSGRSHGGRGGRF